jgi:hypothetical protein
LTGFDEFVVGAIPAYNFPAGIDLGNGIRQTLRRCATPPECPGHALAGKGLNVSSRITD